MPPWEGADAGAAGSSPAGGTADCGAPPCAQAGDLPRRKCRWSQACFTSLLAGAQETEVRQSNVDSGSACLLLLAADRQSAPAGVRRKPAPPLAGGKNSGKLGRHRYAAAVVYVGIQVAARLTGQTFRSKRRSSAVPAGGYAAVAQLVEQGATHSPVRRFESGRRYKTGGTLRCSKSQAPGNCTDSCCAGTLSFYPVALPWTCRAAGHRPAASEIDGRPMFRYYLGQNPMRGKEVPVSLPIKLKNLWPVTLRIAKQPADFIPL